MCLGGIITVGRKVVNSMNNINKINRYKSQTPLTESMTSFHLEEDEEKIEQCSIMIRRQSLSSELFSPVRGPDTSYSDRYGQEEDVRMSLDEYLSPSREQQSDMTNLDLSKMTPLTSTRISEDDDLMTSSPENIDSEYISLEMLSLREKIGSQGPHYNSESISEDEKKLESFNWSEFVEQRHKPVKLSLDSEVELADNWQDMGPGRSRNKREDDINTCHRPKAETTTNSTIHNHSIRKVVVNVMEEWKSGLERRLWEMQYAFIRQLQRDQEEIRMILDEAGERVKVKKELETVRAENKELRKFFGRVLCKQ